MVSFWQKKFKKEKGFTLIEMLVALFIFSLIVGVLIGLFISGIRNQRNILLTQQLLDQTSFALEYMSRALRMALKEGQQSTGGNCLSQRGLNYENPGSDSSRIKFINHLEQDDCQEFFLEEGRIKQIKERGQVVSLTSDKLEVTSLKFNLIGQDQSDQHQPRVTIFLKIRGRGSLAGTIPELNIQTTISQRNLDVQE
jgi:prepilin-type N-terminal cleavage/methylation domain-containing protein